MKKHAILIILSLNRSSALLPTNAPSYSRPQMEKSHAEVTCLFKLLIVLRNGSQSVL